MVGRHADVGAHRVPHQRLRVVGQGGRQQRLNRRAHAVDDAAQVRRLLARIAAQLLQRCRDGTAAGMPQHHHQPGAKALGCELDTADLRGRDDIAGHADHEQVAQTLVKDDLGRHPGVRASQNDGEGELLVGQFNATPGAGGVLAIAAACDETGIAVAQPLQCLWCRNHPRQCPRPSQCCQFDGHSPRLSESQPLHCAGRSNVH